MYVTKFFGFIDALTVTQRLTVMYFAPNATHTFSRGQVSWHFILFDCGH